MKRAGLALAALLVGAVVLGGIWYFKTQSGTTGPSTNTNTTATPLERPAPPVGEYETRAALAVQPLRAAIDANDAVGLDAAVPTAKVSLMTLVVPSDARSAHLALILALAKYEQAKAEGGDTSSAQTDIKRALEAFPQSP